MNPYKVLGIPADSSSEYIKQKYRILAQQLHPDKNNGNDELFKEIKLAYEILIDPERRKLYDTTGKVDKNPSARSEALNVLSEIVTHFLNQIDPDMDDLILKIKIEIVERKRTTRKNLDRCNNYIKDLNKIIAKIRLKNNDSENVIKMFATNQLNQRLSEKANFEHYIEVFSILEDLIENYHYGLNEWIVLLENN